MTYVFTKPQDSEAFESFFHETFLPMVREIPYALRIEMGKPVQQISGSQQIHTTLDVFFDDEDTMNRAHASVEGKRISRLLMSNPKLNLQMIVSEIEVLQ